MTTIERLMAERDLLLSAISPEDYAKVQKQMVVISETPDPGSPLSDADIALIHNGLLIPNERSIQSMAREIRKWRGVPNPDLI